MLDFLEGALLGSEWTDTDFENKKYNALVALFSTVFWLFFANLVYKLNTSFLPRYVTEVRVYEIILFTVFFLSPFLSYIYYKLPFVFRPLILFAQALKFASVIMLFYSFVLPYFHINIRQIMADGILFFDHTMGSFVEIYTEQYRELGMFLSGLFLLVVGIVLGLLILFFLAKLPQILLRLLRYLQKVYDQFVLTIVDCIIYFRAKKRLTDN